MQEINEHAAQQAQEGRRIKQELDDRDDQLSALSTQLQRLESRLGGVHLELTGEDVTECLGGARDLTEKDLERAYRSQVDPRLNYEQAMELALKIAGLGA